MGPRDDAGVTEVLSSVLVVGITTVMMGGLAVLLFSLPGPTERVHVDLGLSLEKGSGAWGSGDEKLVLTHLGGEPLTRGRTTIEVLVEGTPTSYEGAGLGSVFDGDFVLGEEWRATRTIASGQRVEITVVGPTAIVYNDEVTAG